MPLSFYTATVMPDFLEGTVIWGQGFKPTCIPVLRAVKFPHFPSLRKFVQFFKPEINLELEHYDLSIAYVFLLASSLHGGKCCYSSIIIDLLHWFNPIQAVWDIVPAPTGFFPAVPKQFLVDW